MSEIKHAACLGAGVIGASWAALFLASGRSVAIYDPGEGVEKSVREYIERAWPAMEELGLTGRGNPDAVSFHADAAEAVDGAGFMQESVPERLPIKNSVYSEVENALPRDAVVASSASGLTLGQMQQGWRDPSRLILGHPFNPPHLIPLVEVMANTRTDSDVLELAEAFYADVGKVTIRVNKEVPGHVANRLQAAIWREAIHLITTGVASVGDVDKAIQAGPGLRWAAMGPTTLFSLGAHGGLQAFFDHFTDTFNGWWDDLGRPYLSREVIEEIVAGLHEATEGQSEEPLVEKRDAMILAIRAALRKFEDGK